MLPENLSGNTTRWKHVPTGSSAMAAYNGVQEANQAGRNKVNFVGLGEILNELS
jgi:hypothetical protein